MQQSEFPPGPDSGLSAADKRTLLCLARETLTAYLERGTAPVWDAGPPALLEPGAAFVTLWRRETGELRGCRGECVARRPLAHSVALTAIAAATDDPRFPPVTLDEMPAVRIEINTLEPLMPIAAADVEVGRHGLMLVQGACSGLLLPEVPVRYRWDREAFLRALCRKAGLPEDAWSAPDARLYAFETEAWAEDDDT